MSMEQVLTQYARDQGAALAFLYDRPERPDNRERYRTPILRELLWHMYEARPVRLQLNMPPGQVEDGILTPARPEGETNDSVQRIFKPRCYGVDLLQR